MQCNNCGSKDIESDQTRGDIVCRNCGKVLEEGLVVNEVSFENTKVMGTFISDNMGGGNIP
jgi:transcription initiation factor TFIIIB Brf1 subunit/transcription initiation factor TFIIB